MLLRCIWADCYQLPVLCFNAAIIQGCCLSMRCDAHLFIRYYTAIACTVICIHTSGMSLVTINRDCGRQAFLLLLFSCISHETQCPSGNDKLFGALLTRLNSNVPVWISAFEFKRVGSVSNNSNLLAISTRVVALSVAA